MLFHNRLRPFIHVVLYALLASCVTPYQPETKSLAVKQLIVSGYITDQPGPHLVTLTYTADFSSAAVNFYATGANVSVSDNAGNRQALTEISTGIYRTPAAYKGQAGRSYMLNITLADGRTYKSTPETIRPVPPIDRIYDEYVETPVAGTAVVRKGFNVYLDTKDPATTGDYYRWNWTHYGALTFCEVRSVAVGTTNVEYGYRCCEACWEIVRCGGTPCLNATSDEQINGNSISRQFLLRVPFSSFSRYYLELEQLSISRDAFIYYKTIEDLTKNNGGIFDAAPATLRGNIVSLTNPGELVFGYFGASGVQKVPYSVDRTRGQGKPDLVSSAIDPPSPPPPPCAACQESAFRTRTKPRWWPN